MRIAGGVFGLVLLSGCASTYEPSADAGSPYPAWCAELVRNHARMSDPGAGGKPLSELNLPPECRDGDYTIRLRPARLPDR